MKINRLLTNICSLDLPGTKTFYTKLFDLTVDFDSDWFIHLVDKNGALELGIIQRDHAIVPEKSRKAPQGIYLTFVVDNVDRCHEVAQAEGFAIVSPPEDTFYGQRRLLLEDPNGVIVDVSAPIPNFSPG